MTTVTLPQEQLRLEVTDTQGERTITVDKSPYHIGRRENNDLRLAGVGGH
jgi:hypothetical protein